MEKSFWSRVRVVDIKGREMTFKLGKYYLRWYYYPTWAEKDVNLTVTKEQLIPGDGVEEKPSFSTSRSQAVEIMKSFLSEEADQLYCVIELASLSWWRANSQLAPFLARGRDPLPTLRGALIHLGQVDSQKDIIRALGAVRRGVKLGLWEERWVGNFQRARERMMWRRMLK